MDDLKRQIAIEGARIKAYSQTTLGQLAGCSGDCPVCSHFHDVCPIAQHLHDLCDALLHAQIRYALDGLITRDAL